MSKNDGGQAFPHGDMVPGGCTGMTLRDYFTALQQKVTPLALPEVTDEDEAEAWDVLLICDGDMRKVLESYRARLMAKTVPNG